MTKAYVYIFATLHSGTIIKIRGEDSWLLACFETRVKHKEKIMEVASKFCPDGYNLLWIEDGHKNASVKIAEQDFEHFIGCTMTGRELREVLPF